MPVYSGYSPRISYDSPPRTPVTVTVYADASLNGFGFWSPQINRGFHGNLPSAPLLNDINFMEFYAVANAISWASKRLKVGDHLCVYTDSLNTADKFNGGPVKQEYYDLVDAVWDLVREAGVSLSVLHIPRHMNDIADCLSRPGADFECIHDQVPDLNISHYNVSTRIQSLASFHSY